jgi:hypothetical protein
VIHYDRRWLTIRWDDTIEAVILQWKSYAEGKDYRESLEAALALVRQRHATRWLSDSRRLGPIRQEDQLWTVENFSPRLNAHGVRWVAIVSPQAAVSRLSVKQILTKTTSSSEIVSVVFDSPERAREWLRNPTKPTV